MRAIIRAILFAILILIACKKNKDVPAAEPQEETTPPLVRVEKDTVYPGAYYPVYPGSWWKYKAKNTDTALIKATGWFRDSVVAGNELWIGWVPRTSLNFWGYLRQDNIGNAQGNSNPTLVPEVSEVKGSIWTTGYSSSVKQPVSSTVYAVDTSATVFGHTYNPVIIVRTYSGYPPGGTLINSRYYARDVGLIMVIVPGGDTTRLVSYHINK